MTALTDTELEAIKTVGDAASCAKLDGTPGDNATALGSLLSLLGAEADTPIGAIGMIPVTDFDATRQAWVIEVPGTGGAADTNRPPTLVESGKASYLARLARARLGLEAATQTTSLATTSVPTPISSTGIRRIKMNQVLSQLDETEVDVVSSTEQLRMFARYETLFGKGQRPNPNQEPSVEQLSGLKALVDSHQCPYADFAIFQPHAARIMKKIKFSGLILTKSGALSQAELYGPPDLDSWRSCYDVWCNAMIMLDQIDLGPLQLYKNRIELLHSRYGESRVWSLLYQADTRSRLEHLPRTKLALQQEHNEATAAGKTTPYDVNRPWNHALHTVANDDRYWTHEFVEPALIVMSDSRQAGSLVRDDARVEPQDKATSQHAPASSNRPSSAASPRTRNTNRTGRVHDFVDGAYRTNRTGYSLCGGFNDGTCTNTIQGSWCGTHKDHAHQCSRCLGSHSVQKCPHAEAPSVGWIKDRREKGRGKGGRKGKGRRNPY